MADPERDYDTDTISVTSTVSSDAGVEYDVEDIISEGWDDDGAKYLVKWAGYPIHRLVTCSFQSETLLTGVGVRH
jgi:hypothetical protein